ncbi:MAG: hypothetical protein KatS3mg109_0509 [Pirellulaceae bacterium]|nr:MAG: hypothetical protein KatS3mg109_0509 [Pirellulaceae bacterium]
MVAPPSWPPHVARPSRPCGSPTTVVQTGVARSSPWFVAEVARPTRQRRPHDSRRWVIFIRSGSRQAAAIASAVRPPLRKKLTRRTRRGGHADTFRLSHRRHPGCRNNYATCWRTSLINFAQFGMMSTSRRRYESPRGVHAGYGPQDIEERHLLIHPCCGIGRYVSHYHAGHAIPPSCPVLTEPGQQDGTVCDQDRRRGWSWEDRRARLSSPATCRMAATAIRSHSSFSGCPECPRTGTYSSWCCFSS